MVRRVDCNSDLIARMHAEVSRGGLLPSVAVAIPANTVLKDEESARNNYVLACEYIFTNIHRLKKSLRDSAINLSLFGY